MNLKSADSKCSVRRQYFSAILVCLNTFSFGCLVGWISPVISQISNDKSPLGRAATESEISLMASLVCIGAILGVILFGYLADKFGRKKSLFIVAFPYLICWVLKAFSGSVEAVIVGRFFAGAAGSGSMVIAPIYCAEIATSSSRGKLTSLAVVSTNVGILYAYVGGVYLSYGVFMWTLLIIPIIYYSCSGWIPETPAYSIKKGNYYEAQKTLSWLRDVPEDSRVIRQLMDELKREEMATVANSTENVSWRKICFQKPFLKLLGIVVTLIMIQSFIGIYAIVSFSSKIFEDAGGSLSSNESSIVLACEQLVGSYISILLIEKLGRKPLFVISAGMVAIGMGSLGLYLYMKHLEYDLSNVGWIPVISLSLALMMSSVGVGPIPIIFASEAFVVQVRSIAMTVVILVLWINSFIVSQFYNSVIHYIGDYTTFWIFTVVAIFGVVFSLLFVPETKGESHQKLKNLMDNNQNEKSIIVESETMFLPIS